MYKILSKMLKMCSTYSSKQIRFKTTWQKVVNPFLPNGTACNPLFAKKENLESSALQVWQQAIGIQCRRAG